VLLTCLALGCGFEARVEGTWKLAPGDANQRELARHLRPPMAQTFASSAFVVEDGVVYLAAKHPDNALAKYQIGRIEHGCADVRLETAAVGAGAPTHTPIEACLDGDALTVRHLVDGEAAVVTLRRAD
jgi:hypothetical protein